jgi:glycosyltransferase involved in cell wall biosynthesis
MDILCFSSTDWDEIWGSRQQIMQRLAAAGNRVLFVERQVSIEHLIRDHVLFRRKIARWRGSLLKESSKNLWLWCPPLMLPGRYYSMWLNHLGQHHLVSQIRPVLASLTFDHPILWLYPPHSAPLLGHLDESCSIYHCIDRFSGNQKGLKRSTLEKQEKLLLENVDLVFTHSEGLRQKYHHLTRRPITLIPSAADVSLYQSTASIHPRISHLPRPRIGIMGTFDGRIDVNLLQNLVISHPDWQFVLIGQIRPGRTRLEKIFHYPNVHYLGARPQRELPVLLNGMDVFLIAYQLNELTEFISPLKLFEYLAIGKPIVSVPLPEVLPLSSYVYIANPDEFSTRIEQALESDSSSLQHARREEAKKHTWDIRVQTMVETINEFYSGNCL